MDKLVNPDSGGNKARRRGRLPPTPAHGQL